MKICEETLKISSFKFLPIFDLAGGSANGKLTPDLDSPCQKTHISTFKPWKSVKRHWKYLHLSFSTPEPSMIQSSNYHILLIGGAQIPYKRGEITQILSQSLTACRGGKTFLSAYEGRQCLLNSMLSWLLEGGR